MSKLICVPCVMSVVFCVGELRENVLCGFFSTTHPESRSALIFAGQADGFFRDIRALRETTLCNRQYNTFWVYNSILAHSGRLATLQDEAPGVRFAFLALPGLRLLIKPFFAFVRFLILRFFVYWPSNGRR